MADIEAIAITSIGGALASDDGQYVLLKLCQSPSDDLAVAIPTIEIGRLVDAVCGASAEGLKRQGTNVAIATEATWFEFGKDPNGENVLALTFGTGGKLWFRLPGKMMNNMREVLNGAAAPSTVPKPDKLN